MGAGDGLRTVARDDFETVAALGESHVTGADDDVDALGLQDVLDGRGDVLVLAGGQPRTPLDHGHAGAEAAVHLRELQRDVAAADDDQMLWQRVEFEDADIGQVVDVGQPRHVGHHRPAADVEEDPVGFEDAGRPTRMVCGSSKRACPRIKVQPSMPSSQDSTPSRSPRTISSLRALTFAMSTLTLAGADPVVGAAACDVGGVRTGDQGLGGNASGVDAGAADEFALDHRDGLAGRGQPTRQRWPGLPGADDDRVELFCHRTWFRRG